MLSQMNKDILQCIIMSINTVDDLKSLYLTNKTFWECLNDNYIITLLTLCFNVIYIFHKDDPHIDNHLTFKYFIYWHGSLYVPHCVRYKKESLQTCYFTQFNGCQPYKVMINQKQIKV